MNGVPRAVCTYLSIGFFCVFHSVEYRRSISQVAEIFEKVLRTTIMFVIRPWNLFIHLFHIICILTKLNEPPVRGLPYSRTSCAVTGHSRSLHRRLCNEYSVDNNS